MRNPKRDINSYALAVLNCRCLAANNDPIAQVLLSFLMNNGAEERRVSHNSEEARNNNNRWYKRDGIIATRRGV
jgi:hypothetical protein